MKNKFLALLAGLAVLMSLSSCADRAGGKSYSGLGNVSSGTGRIVVYRPHTSYINQGGSPFVYINDVKKDVLKVEGYLSYSVNPGEHNVTVKNFWSWNVPLDLDVKVSSGQTVYLRLWTEAEILGGRYLFAKVDPAMAQAELKKMRSVR